jgi:hypothetical protein
MSFTKKEAARRDVCVDNADALALVKRGLADLLNAAAVNGFDLPILFRVVDNAGDALREFSVRHDGVKLISSAAPERVFPFPLVVVARDVHGRTARIKLSAESVGAVEFLKGAPS